MKKLDSLKKLREFIMNEDLELASCTYSSDGCNCVVGHLLKLGDMTDKDLIEIENERPYGENYAISALINYIKYYEVKDAPLFNTLVNLGFNPEGDKKRLTRLQCANDDYGKDSVIIELDLWITELEGENV